MDNSQGKCGRYKIKLRPFTHWSNEIIALSHVSNDPLRRRIAVAPNDSKSSRFKGLAIVRIQTSHPRSIEYAIACIPPSLFPFVNQLRNEITMTPPISTGIQVSCFLPIDPPHRNEILDEYQFQSPLPPSTAIKLPPNIIPPPLLFSTPPPSNVTTP